MSRSFNPWDDGAELTKQIARVGSPTEDDVRASVATRKVWEAAVAALRVDASAQLPDTAGD